MCDCRLLRGDYGKRIRRTELRDYWIRCNKIYRDF